MTRDEVQQIVFKLLAEQSGPLVEGDQLWVKHDLSRDLDIDDVGMVNAVLDLEYTLHIVIDDDAKAGFGTVGQVLDYCCDQLKKQGRLSA